MTYIPNILDYKPFYIQTSADQMAIDTTYWGMVAKTNPLTAMPDPKDPYKNDWKDEDGVEEYVGRIYYKPIEFEVEFFVKTYDEGGVSSITLLNQQMNQFFEKIRNGEFMVYDSYTGIGRQKVRYAGYSEESFKARDKWSRAIFKIKFVANDPISKVVLSNGKLAVV